MLAVFGNSIGSAFDLFAPAPAEDPGQPCPRARAEMEAFDLLPSPARAAVRESPNDVALAQKLFGIRRRGAPRSVLERCRARGILPGQLGLGGILAELVADELSGSAQR